MKIAVLGGSFNPLHNGHAMLADTVIKELGYDRVLFVPTFIPPHKKITGGLTPEQRLELVRTFCQSDGDGHFVAEPCEIERGGVSYTSETLAYIKEKYKDVIEGKPAFVMGEEVAAEFSKWKNPGKIAEIADFIIVPRFPDAESQSKSALCKNTPTGDYKGDFGEKFSKEKFGYPCTIIPNPMIPVSSTEIRARIKTGRSYKYLVPQSVFEYIEGILKREGGLKDFD